MNFVISGTDTNPCQEREIETADTSPTLSGAINLYLVCPINQLCKQWRNFAVFTQAHLNMRRVGRIGNDYTNPRRRQGFANSVEFSQTPSCLDKPM